MGSFTGAIFNKLNVMMTGTSGTDEEQSSWKVSYTVSDNLSVSYGEETHETAGETVDEEFESNLCIIHNWWHDTLTAQQYIEAEGLGNTSGAAR